MYGMPIIIDASCDDVPRMRCSHEFVRVMTPELVASTNAWMLEFFGTEDKMYILDNPFTGAKSLVMGPKSWAKMPKQSKKCIPWEWGFDINT